MSAAQNVTGNVNINCAFTQTQSTGIIGPQVGTNSQTLNELISIANQILNGAGVSMQVDQLYAQQLTLAASATTLHFETATAHDPFNNTLAMLRIRLIAVQNVTVTSGFDVKVEGSASDGITWKPPSANPLFARANFGLVLIYDPNSVGGSVGNVVGATTDGLTLDPGSNTCVVNVLVAGSSVA